MTLPVDHPILGAIALTLFHEPSIRSVFRLNGSVEFTDRSTGRSYEVVVRPIDTERGTP